MRALVDFVMGLLGSEQRHLCQCDVTVEDVEACGISSLYFSGLREVETCIHRANLNIHAAFIGRDVV